MATAEVHLELAGVSKRYGSVRAVEELCLAVPRGSVFGLLGPNGAGKTTTIRMVMRITLPDSGVIHLNGVPMDDALRERLGYLPEERGLYRKMKVIEHLAFLGEIRGLGRGEAQRRAAAWLERLGLADKARAPVEELSKGMQQKVQFAGAVLHEPELVILDEPFTALDPIATRQLKQELTAMAAGGVTVVFSTHVLSQAEELCSHLCLMNRGRAILQGTLGEVRARFGGSALRLRCLATPAEVAAVPVVRAVHQRGDDMLLELAPGISLPAAIRALAHAVPVLGVEPYGATLEEIFLRAVEEDRAAAS